MSTASCIDLRSDTVTRPGPAMREAMVRARVGDDVFGDDPTVHALQTRVAEMLGKEAALLVPSGTMANQVALMCHCQRGDEVLVGEGSHVQSFEAGAGAVLAGVTITPLRGGGLFDASAMLAAIQPDDPHFPRSRLVVVENTHNRAGGRVFPLSQIQEIASAAHARGLAVHMDGARVWNAALASGRTPAELTAPVDSVSACFSKGLGAPVGSVLAGSRRFVAQALRYRKMLGGGMRQAGVLAAAALHALDHQRDRLADDHANARRLAEGLARLPGLICDVDRVETNIVVFGLRDGSSERTRRLLADASDRGVLLTPFGEGRIRAVTHLDVTRTQIDDALTRLSALLGEA